MNIAERIRKEMCKYKEKTGMDVWCIYLGHTQAQSLMRWAEDNKHAAKHLNAEGKNRTEFHGALIFQVDDDDHINVS